MKKIGLLSLVLAALLQGCGIFKSQDGKNGELTGVTDRPVWDNPIPFGMLTIPAGSFHMGQNDQDVNYSQIAHNRQITMSSFFMDETEITNNEYRQYISATVAAGAQAFTDSVINFLGSYYKKQVTPQEYMELIYPDTLVWRRDFSYTYNEPLVENYWSHPAFDEYPLVGVSWYGAQAFCYWRTMLYNDYRTNRKSPLPLLPRFRLPTEAEWEYAARGGFEHKIYPWEGPYIRNSRGCLYANFKPGRGDYIADNYEYTCPVDKYWPNDYGLYQMSGNVAEWCEDDFEESGYSYAHDLNPIYKDPTGRATKRIIRGGSWKDISYFLSVGTRTYEYADTTKSFLGFRCVVSVIGRSQAYSQ